MATSADTAWVDVLPSMQGFLPALRNAVGSAAVRVGTQAGQEFAQGFDRGMGSSLGKTGGQLDEVSKSTKDLAGVQRQAAASGQDMSNSLDKVAGSADRTSRGLDVIKHGFATLTVGAGSAIAAAAGVGIKTAAQMETANIGFTTMLGSAAKAQDFLGKLQKFAAATPFEFPQLQTAASSLISIGIDANKVIPIMTTLGNVTSGMGTGSEGIQRATVAIQQMNAAGRITAEDLNQLRDAGIPVFDLLTAATGKTKEEIAAMAQNGKLGRKELEQLMSALETGKGLERFNGMMEAQSQSLTGLWSTLKDTFSVGMAEAIQPLIPMLKDGLAGAINFVAAAMPKVQSGLASLAQGGVVLASNLKGVWDILAHGEFSKPIFGQQEDSRFVDFLFDVRDVLLSVGDAIRNRDIGSLGASFSSAGSAVGPLLGFFQGLGSAAVDLGRSVGGLVGSALPIFVFLLQSAAGIVGFFADHTGLLTAALVGLVAVLAVHRAAQTATNLLEAAALPLRVAEIAANFALASANRALAFQLSVLTGAQQQGRLASLASAAATTAQAIASGIARAATATWTAVQTAFNAVMSANPIVLVTIAIAALVAGVIYAWNNFQWFRDIVLGVWGAIKTAAEWAWENGLKPVFTAFAAVATWLWQNVLQPVFGAIGIAWSALMTGVQWAWTNILQPTWNFIQAAASFLLTFLTVLIFGPIMLAWQALTIAFQWAWDNILHPVWIAVETAARWLWENALAGIWAAMGFAWNLLLTGIQWAWDNILHPVWIALELAASWLWNNVLMPIWAAMGFAWNLLLAGIQWAWNNVLHPVWIALEVAARWLWDSVLMPIWAAMGFAWNLLVTGMQWVWDNILHPVWIAVETAARWLWDVVLSPIFGAIGAAWGAMTAGMQWAYDHIIKPLIIDPFAAAIGFLKGAFETAVEGIRGAWDRIKGIAAVPINFVVRTVLRDGLFAAWNWVLDQLGIKDWHVNTRAPWLQGIPGFAGGGQIDGPYRGPAADNMLALVGNDGVVRVNPNEYVQPVHAVDRYGVDFMEAVRTGAFPADVARAYTGDPTYPTTSQLRRDPAWLESLDPMGIPGYAYGGVMNHVAAAGDEIQRVFGRMPGGIGGKAPRANASEHPKGLALDFMTLNNLALGDRVEQYIYDNARRLALKYNIFKQRIRYPGGGWSRMENRGSITANHFDHVHTSFMPQPGMVGTDPGGGAPVEDPWYVKLWKTVEGAKTWLTDSIKSVGELASRFGASPFTGWLGQLPGKLVGGAWDKIKETVGNLFSGFGANVSGSGNTPSGGSPALKQQAFQIGRSFGFTGAATEAAIDYIVSNESGWNPRAQNPTSTASGLWQHIRGTWQANRPNTASRFANMKDAPTDLQDVAGFNYIQGKFGNPIAAQRYWMAHHYYDTGGVWPSGTAGLNTSGGDERVLAPQQDDYFRRFVDVTDRAVDGGDRRALIQTVNLNVRDNDTAFQAIDELEHRLRVADLGGRYAWTST